MYSLEYLYRCGIVQTIGETRRSMVVCMLKIRRGVVASSEL